MSEHNLLGAALARLGAKKPAAASLPASTEAVSISTATSSLTASTAAATAKSPSTPASGKELFPPTPLQQSQTSTEVTPTNVGNSNPTPLSQTTQNPPQQLQQQHTVATPNVANATGGGTPVPPPLPPPPPQPPQQLAAVPAAPNQQQPPMGLAAALDRLPATNDQAQLKSELQWQQSVSAQGGPSWEEFRDTALGLQTLVVFAWMDEGSPYVQLLFAPKKYVSRDRTHRLHNKIIAFVGDRDEGVSPDVIKPQPEKAWKWYTVTACFDAVQHAAYFGTEGNRLLGWRPTNAEPTKHSDEMIPYMLNVTGKLAKFLATGQRTPNDLLVYAEGEVNADNSVLEGNDITLLRKWCMAAGQTSAGGDSILKLKMDGVTCRDPTFIKWRAEAVKTALGAMPPAPTQVATPQGQTAAVAPPPPGGDNPYTLVRALGTEMRAIFQPLAEAKAAEATTTTSQKSKGKIYDQFHLAWLRGWANVAYLHQLPEIWAEWQESKCVVRNRELLKAKMLAWSQKYNIDIDTSVYFSDQMIDDLINLVMAKGGAILATAERGLSILACALRTMADTVKAEQLDEAIRASRPNMTQEEALKLSAKGPRPPPCEFNEVKLCLGTFTALNAVVVGEVSSFYINLKELRMAMSDEYMMKHREKYRPHFFRQLIWAIHDDMCSYFDERLHPNHFAVFDQPDSIATLQTHPVPFPVSRLRGILDNMFNGNAISRISFPAEWQPSATKKGTDTQATNTGTSTTPDTQVGDQASRSRRNQRGGAHDMGGGGRRGRQYQQQQQYYQQQSNWQPPQYGNNQYGQYQYGNNQYYQQPPHQQQQQQQGNPQDGDVAHVHPTILQCMQAYHQKYNGRIRLRGLLDAGRITQRDLPTINGVNVCYNHAMGKCTVNNCSYIHVPGREIPNTFATELCQVITPCVDAVLRRGEPDNSRNTRRRTDNNGGAATGGNTGLGH